MNPGLTALGGLGLGAGLIFMFASVRGRRHQRQYETHARQRQHEMGAGTYRGRGPRGYRRSDERIREDVNDRLTDDPNLDASDIEVGVDSGVVALSGTVNNRSDKRRAESLAESVSGVTDVNNQLRVSRRPQTHATATEMADTARSRTART